MDKKKIKTVASEFHICALTVKKYLNMTEADIQALDKPKNYKKRTTVMDDHLNLIFKMMNDGMSDEVIYYYVLKQGYTGNQSTLRKYLQHLSKNNFPEREAEHICQQKQRAASESVQVIKRNALLKSILTVDPKKKKDPVVEGHLDLIEQRYPIVKKIETAFKSFHSVLMGEDPNKLDNFLEMYQGTKLSSFCEGIKKDIAPVKNAISYDVSSGFVEGNNNKFKLIKRIVYGRAGLVNLSKKCYLLFSVNEPDFDLHKLV